MSHRVIHDWDEHRFHRVISDAFRMPTGAQSGYIITSDAAGNFSWQPGGGGGGGATVQYWQDTGTNLQPLSAGRGVSLGVAGGMSISAGNRLHLEGPNGVEVVGLMLQPIGSIFPVAGTLQWTAPTNGALQVYDGTKWLTIAGIPPGSPGGLPLGYWLEDSVNNELLPQTANRNVHLQGAILFDAARQAGIRAGPSTLNFYSQNGGFTFTSFANGETAEVNGAGCWSLHAPNAITTNFYERLQLDAGIVVGTALSILPGTIQYTGGHFYGRNATAWILLEGGGGGGGTGQPGSPGNPLAPTTVVPGTYGDGLDVPQYTVQQDGRLTYAANVPINFAAGVAGLGPNTGGTIIGIYPNLSLPDLVPPIPAGTYGDATHLPTFTVNTKGLVTHAYQTEIRPARDPMNRLQLVNQNMDIDDNNFLMTLDLSFTPLATGKGWVGGCVQGRVYNGDTNPTAGTLHYTYVTMHILFDGTELHRIQRYVTTWEPGAANAACATVTIPFEFPWVADINVVHRVQVNVSNFKNSTESVVTHYPMHYGIDDARLMISEDPEPGVGTNSSYLMAGALVGPAIAGVAGSYVAAYQFVLPGGLGGSWGWAKSPSAAEVDWNVQVNGVVKGTIQWLAGNNSAAFNFPNPVTVHIGDLVEIIGAAGVGDTTWTLRGTL
jgi:hypothetical protein